MKEYLITSLNFLGLAWWVEIVTLTPICTYYFGPFMTESEAEMEKYGYIEDLENEGALGITVKVKRCKPEILTICEDDWGNIDDSGMWPILSGQP